MVCLVNETGTSGNMNDYRRVQLQRDRKRDKIVCRWPNGTQQEVVNKRTNGSSAVVQWRMAPLAICFGPRMNGSGIANTWTEHQLSFVMPAGGGNLMH